MTIRSTIIALGALASVGQAVAADNRAPAMPDRSATRITNEDCKPSGPAAASAIERASLPTAGPLDGLGIELRRERAAIEFNCEADESEDAGEVE